MKRRDFVAGLGGTVALPLAARGQQPAVLTVGYLANASPEGFAPFVAAFRQGLREVGFIEGQNIAIEYRWADGQQERLAEFAADLVRREVAVIMATGGNAPSLAAKAATASIPIVFTGGGDPVKLGLVENLNRPGGNATGAINIGIELVAKRFEVLRELLPLNAVIATLFNPANPDARAQMVDVQEAARAIGHQIRVFNVGRESELELAFAAMTAQGVNAVFVGGDPLFTNHRSRLIALAARHAFPASYAFRVFAVEGGLMSYGVDLSDIHRRAGVYAGRILRGAKPSELPVLLPVKFQLVINLKAAKALGLSVPQSLLARADEVIE
jgi:putative ABC transport system substrate-binding protein